MSTASAVLPTAARLQAVGVPAAAETAAVRDLGLRAGQDYAFATRWAGSDANRFPALAAELLADQAMARLYLGQEGGSEA